MKYICGRCGYNTVRKGDFRKHLNRKHTCEAKLSDINIDEIKEKYGFYNIAPKNTKITPKTHQNTPKHTKIHQNTPKYYYCEYCDKKFTRSESKKRHERSRCNVKKELDKKNMKSDNILITELKDIIAKKDKIINKMMKQMEKMLEKVGNNNSTINITLKNYGNEDISYLSNLHFEKLLSAPFTCIPKLIKNIHFNTNHPENMNVRITNKKLPYAEVYKDDTWKIQDKKETIKELVNDKIDILDDKFGEVQDTMYPHKKDNYKRFQSIREKDDILKNIEKESELEILNGSK